MPKITVMGVPRETEIERIPLDKIRLDLSNVRFDHLKGPLDEQKIEEWIWDEEDTRALMRAIIASKGLTNRPVVIPKGRGTYVVKEGNRRIVALRKIKETINKGKLTESDFPEDYLNEIECEVLPVDMPEIEVDIYLAREHVTGKREWAALNQASHFYSLYLDHSLPYDKIVDLLEVSKPTVVRAINALKASKEYLGQNPDDALGIRRYTYFDEFFKKKDIREAYKMDPTLLDRFYKWISEDKFRDHRQVRRLPEVLENPKALEALENANMDEAIKVVEAGVPPHMREPSYALIQSTIEVMQSMPRSEIAAIRQDKTKYGLIKTLQSEVEALVEEIEKKKA